MTYDAEVEARRVCDERSLDGREGAGDFDTIAAALRAAHAAGVREGTDYSAVLGERWAQDRLAELAAQSEEIGRLIVERERLRDAARDLIAAVTVETIGDAAGTAGPEPFVRLAAAIGGDQ